MHPYPAQRLPMTALLLDRPSISEALKPYLSRQDLAPRHGPAQNQLLAALPAAEFERLAPHLELVSMPLGDMIYQSGRALQYAYFPTTAIVSLHYVMQSGETSESASVANEGVVGVALFMGGDTTTSSAVVQIAGHGYRLPASALKEEFNRAGFVQRLLMRYTQALIAQMAQTVACNRYHQLEQQFCRWLLLTHDRIRSPEVVTTQELVASILGVRREGITGAAGRLQRAGVIRCHRGHMTVLDRSALEARACECYSVVRTEFRRLLSDVRPCKGISADARTVASQGPALNRSAWRTENRTAGLL
jgi:CRP-like cAMP-binding protein